MIVQKKKKKDRTTLNGYRKLQKVCEKEILCSQAKVTMDLFKLKRKKKGEF